MSNFISKVGYNVVVIWVAALVVVAGLTVFTYGLKAFEQHLGRPDRIGFVKACVGNRWHDNNALKACNNMYEAFKTIDDRGWTADPNFQEPAQLLPPQPALPATPPQATPPAAPQAAPDVPSGAPTKK